LPEPKATPQQDQLAMLKATPPPAFRDATELVESTPPELKPSAPPINTRPLPPSASSAYQRERTQTRITGRIGDRGPSSVNAVSTPLGRYQKAISDAIGARWYTYVQSRMDLVSVGTAVIAAEVDGNGKVTNLRVVSNSANEAFANVCLQSFQEAKIDPIPPDLIATLPDGKMQLEFTFTTYANR
jgi:TonB family protein